jgi:hypothetical protein
MDSYKTIEAKLQERLPFRGNSLNGFWDAQTGCYVVYSYSTLIASIGENGNRWVNPNKFSQTTSRQQNLIKRAWGLVN